MERLFVDTSAWYAYFNAKDPDHKSVTALLEAWEPRLVTTEYVFDELVTLVRYRAGHGLAAKVGQELRGGEACLLVTVEPKDIQAAWEHFVAKKSEKLSFTDCTSFAVMRRLKLTTAAALDADFGHAGFTVLPKVKR
jgi:predicted nucleic acid-binding protein